MIEIQLIHLVAAGHGQQNVMLRDTRNDALGSLSCSPSDSSARRAPMKTAMKHFGMRAARVSQSLTLPAARVRTGCGRHELQERDGLNRRE